MSITKKTRSEIIDWLHDCFSEQMSLKDLKALSDERLIRAINHHYSGGIEQFIKDSNLDQ